MNHKHCKNLMTLSEYMEIIESLTINELKRFDKHKYKTLIMSDILQVLPNTDKQVVDYTAQYISNLLGNEAPRVKGRKMQSLNKKQKVRRTRSTSSITETATKNNNRQNQQAGKPKEKAKSKDISVLSETFLKELDNTLNLESDICSGSNSNDDLSSEAGVVVLYNTLLNQNDTLDSTVCDSNLDNTYDLGPDTSITVLKSVVQTNDKTKEDKPKQNTTNGGATDSETLTEKQTHFDSGKMCTDDCKIKAESPSICCNICKEWFHPKCVGIKNIDDVGAWVCASCRLLPKTVHCLKLQMV